MKDPEIIQSQNDIMERQPVSIIRYLGKSTEYCIEEDIKEGLLNNPKKLPSKYFYDDQGSKLFEEICDLPEYYVTRTELSLLDEIAPQIMESFAHGDLIEIGSGSHWKIKKFLDCIDDKKLKQIRYIAIDVSESAIIEANQELIENYPHLETLGLVADFTDKINFFDNDRAKMFLFLGSTIGNFAEKDRISLLKNFQRYMTPEDRFLIGFDMQKPINILEKAYNDSKGVTEKFNKNILKVINRELEADFKLKNFAHKAFYNEKKERIEMHLEARHNHKVSLEKLNLEIEIDAGETIHTENSRKFSIETITRLVENSGFRLHKIYNDERKWFSIVDIRLYPKNKVVSHN